VIFFTGIVGDLRFCISVDLIGGGLSLFCSNQSSGQICNGSVGQSGCDFKESFQYWYVCVSGCPGFVDNSECSSGIWAVPGDKSGFLCLCLFALG